MCLVKECGELNATLMSQQHTITSNKSNTEHCIYVIKSSSGSGVEVTITTDMLGAGMGCSSVIVEFNPSKSTTSVSKLISVYG